MKSESAMEPEWQFALKAYKSLRDRFYDKNARLYREHDPRQANDRPYAFVWPYSGVMTAVNALASHSEYGERFLSDVRELADSLEEYWNPAGPVPGYDSCVMRYGSDGRFYDDNEWLGMALLQAGQLLRDDRLLERARLAFRFAVSGWSEEMGGGLYWKEGCRDSKNTCSNGPGAVLALQLYEVDPQPEYLDWASRLLDWTARLKDPDTGVYWDHLKTDGTVGLATWTYNTGSVLHAHVLLYRHTGNVEALSEARRLADASLRHFAAVKGNEVSFPAMPWFNVVLLRGYLALREADFEMGERCVGAFRSYVRLAWKQGPDKRGLFGRDWSVPTRETETDVRCLLDQAAMVEAAALLAIVQ